MTPYLYTITFLTLMTLLTSSEIQHFRQERLATHVYDNYLATHKQMELLKEKSILDDLAAEKSKTTTKPDTGEPSPNPSREPSNTPKPLNVNLVRPPNNSRFNMRQLLFEEKGQLEIGAKLLRHLYQDEEFFTSGMEYAILEELVAQKEAAASFLFPDELASLPFRDPNLRKAFFLMLKGNRGHYPSLLEYITFDDRTYHEHKRINLMYAPERLLCSLIEDESHLAQLLALRTSYWKQIEYQEENRLQLHKDNCLSRSTLKKQLKEQALQIIGLENETLFDYSLGRPGTILITRDESLGITLREKIEPR